MVKRENKSSNTNQKLFFLSGDLAEIADLELQDLLKEPVLMNIKTEDTIFLTFTATLLSLGFLGSTKPFKEDNV